MTKPKPAPLPLPDELIMLTPAQVREALQISETTFDKLVATKQLATIRMDRSRRVSRAALIAFVQAGLAAQ